MAGKTSKKPARKTRGKSTAVPWHARFRKWVRRVALGVVALVVLAVAAYAVINPPTTPYKLSEARRLGGVDHEWVSMDQIAPVMARSVVAAEDANFCLHWGFDMMAIRDAIDGGAQRGASTLSQQVVKNVYLWQARSWSRKALEAMLTPMAELMWSKRRLLEIYLNVAEFGEGVFGVEAAAQHYFSIKADDLSASQAARLAAILPAPKDRSARDPSPFVARRAAAIADGAATIQRDGRAACFEGN